MVTSTQSTAASGRPFNTTSTATTTAAMHVGPPQANGGEWLLHSGACTLDSARCLSSPNYPRDYGGGQSCNASVTAAAAMRVEHFETARILDVLTVDGVNYSGTDGPPDALVCCSVLWRSDPTSTGSGWRLCLAREVTTVEGTLLLSVSEPEMFFGSGAAGAKSALEESIAEVAQVGPERVTVNVTRARRLVPNSLLAGRRTQSNGTIVVSYVVAVPLAEDRTTMPSDEGPSAEGPSASTARISADDIANRLSATSREAMTAIVGGKLADAGVPVLVEVRELYSEVVVATPSPAASPNATGSTPSIQSTTFSGVASSASLCETPPWLALAPLVWLLYMGVRE